MIITTGCHKVQASLAEVPPISHKASLLHEIWEREIVKTKFVFVSFTFSSFLDKLHDIEDIPSISVGIV